VPNALTPGRAKGANPESITPAGAVTAPPVIMDTVLLGSLGLGMIPYRGTTPSRPTLMRLML